MSPSNSLALRVLMRVTTLEIMPMTHDAVMNAVKERLCNAPAVAV